MEQAIDQVIGSALPIVGKVAKNLVGTFLQDTAPIKLDEPGDYAVADLPKRVATQALSVADIHDDQSDVISTIPVDTFRMTSILERCKIMSRLQIVNWNESQTTGTTLFTTVVNPSICANISAAGFRDFLHTALSFYGQLYSFWRGGLRFTIECLPTRFHQGQLYIAFNPNLAAFTLDGARNCTSATIDLGLNNRTTLDVPFVTQTDYLSVPQYPGSIAAPTLLESLGVFSVFVQNPLNSNGTVVTNIDINVYIEALPDFEFKVPRPFRGGTQQYVNGVWQMNEEVVVKELVNPPIHEASQGLTTTVNRNVAVAANVVTADTQNIMEREYLITHGVPVAATDGAGTLLQTMNLPSAFWNTSLATSGLYQFHELYRMDFHVTLRINPTSFHQGALMFVWIPLDLDLTNFSIGTLTQFPHAILNIAAETNASFTIPYSHMIRFLRGTTPDFGALKVFVWNQMKAPTTAPQILYFSIWVQALNPHMAVKRQAGAQVFGEFQMNEVSDTARNVATSQVAFQPATKSAEGFIKSDHMNVLTLLRRPCYAGAQLIPPFPAALDVNQFQTLWTTTVFLGNEHVALLGTYLASSGSNRIVISSSAGRAVDLTMFAITTWEESYPPQPQAAVTSAGEPLGNVYYGGRQWQPAKEQQKVVEVPYYRQFPLVAHWAQRENYVTGWPRMRIGYINQDVGFGTPTGQNVRAMLFHSVGDDFMVYYPICFFQTRIPTTLADALRGRVQLMRAGDIELNPGPDEGCSDIDGDDWRNVMRRVIQYQSRETVFGQFEMFSGAGALVESVKKIGNAMEKFSNTVPAAAASLEKTSDTVNRVLESVEERCDIAERLPVVVDSVKRASDSVTRLLSSDDVKVAQAVASGDPKLFDFLHKWKSISENILHGIVHMYNIWIGGPLKYASVTALLLMTSGYISDQLLNQLKKITGAPTGSGELQSNGLLSIFMGIAPGVCKAILNMWSFEMGDDDTKCFAYRLKEKCADCKGVIQYLIAIGETIVEYVFEGAGFCLNWYKLSAVELSNFSKTVGEAKATQKYTTITLRDSRTQLELRKLYHLAKKIKAYGPQVDRFAVQYLRDAETVCGWMQLMPVAGASSRCPPIGVAFLGKSGTGKSFLASGVFSACLLITAGLASDASEALDLVWPKPTGSDTHFYDGYAQQPITYIDDFLKTVEATDAQDVINMISSSQYPLDMAKLEDKGMLFKSDFVIVTSNTKNFTSVHGLSHPDALCERFKFAYEVKQRDVYIDGVHIRGGDLISEFTRRMEELNRDENGAERNVTIDHLESLVDEFFLFERVDVRGGHNREEVLFFNLVQEVVQAYKNKRTSYKRMTGALRGIKFEMSDVIEDEDSDESFYVPSDEDETLVKVPYTSYKIYDKYEEMIGFVRDAVEKNELDDFRSIAIDHCRFWNVDLEKGKCFPLKDLTKWPSSVTIEDVYASLCHVEKVRSRWKGLIMFCGLAVGAAAVGFGILQLVKWLTRSFCGIMQGALYDSARAAKTHKAVKPRGVMEGVEMMHERIRKNIRTIEIYDMDEDASSASMHCLLLGSKWALLPHHFWLAYCKKKEVGWNVCVRLEHRNPRGESDGWVKIALDPALVKQVNGPNGQEIDLVVAYLHSANINGCRKIEDFIPRRKDFESFADQEQASKLLADDALDDVPVRIGVRDPVAYTVDKGIYTPKSYSVYMLVGDTGTQFTTRLGDCGRPYVTNNPSIRRTLVGLHSAKITSLKGSPTGITPLIWEDIQMAMCMIHTPHCAPLEVKGEIEGNLKKNKFWTSKLHTEGNVEWNGVPLCSYTPTHTDKRRWLEHEEWEDPFLPSCKQVVADRHALYTNAQKCEPKGYNYVPFRVMMLTAEHYCAKFDVERDVSVFTDEQMINGKSPMLPLAQNTSCGFLSKWFKDGKKQLFDGIEEPNGKRFVWSEKARTFVVPIYDCTIVDRVKQVENDLLNGFVPFMPWVATLKDELRPIEKVVACKTRVFEQPPFEFTLLVRKYFGAFTNWVKMRPGFLTHSAIGIDKEAVWRKFYIGLREKGENGFDVDYSNYDGSVCSQAFDFFRIVTDTYYGNECPVRHGLLHILQNSWVIVGDQLMYTEQGNKSGNPMTDLFNSITNVWVLYVSYLDARARCGLEITLADFDRDVAMLTYGDDVIVAAPDTVLSYFNRKTVAHCAEQLGMTVTAANKGEKLLEYEKIEDLTFLKSRFVPDGSLVMAPMPPQVARRELQWIDKHNVYDSRIQKDILRNAMRFMAHNGREMCDQLKRQLQSLGRKVDFSYDDFRLEMFEKQADDGCLSYLNLLRS